MDFIDLKTQYKLISGPVNARLQAIMESSRFIMGAEVSEMETRLAEYTGARHAIGVASGTDALLIAMMALGIGNGDEVITTPFTFIATAETIALLGAKSVFVDIDPATYNINPALIEKAVTTRTKAIIPVSLYGQCADMDAINEIAARHGIPVIEDAAQSFGATYKGKKSCALSLISCTSFFPAKPLGCYGDGGACFTSDDELARKMKLVRLHGQDKRYSHPVIGVNGRIDTMQAAVLLEKLKIFPGEVESRARIGSRYTKLLGKAVKTQTIMPWATSVYAQYTIEVDDREKVRASLETDGIPTAVHYPIPLHMQGAFKSLGHKEGDFPVSEMASQRVLSLPMHPYLDDETQQKVATAVLKAIGK